MLGSGQTSAYLWGKGKQVVLKKQPRLRRWTVSSWHFLEDSFSNKTCRKPIIFTKGNAVCPNAAPYSQGSPCLREPLLIFLANRRLPLLVWSAGLGCLESQAMGSDPVLKEGPGVSWDPTRL